MDMHPFRQKEHGTDDLFLHRWSPRAMSGESIAQETLMTLFEAARWAPSSNNNQPWRFLFACRETTHWPSFLSLLNEGNRVWAAKAAVLIVVISKITFDANDKPARTHSFDAGAAWENLALQGSLLGLVVHGMQGFDYERARTLLEIPETFQVEAMIAVGTPGPKEALPDHLQAREFPSPRKPFSEFVSEGPCPWGSPP